MGALDEADPPPLGANCLFLPLLLPPSCYVVVTTRPPSDPKAPPFKALCEQEIFELDEELAENRVDIASAVRQWLLKPGIKDALSPSRDIR